MSPPPRGQLPGEPGPPDAPAGSRAGLGADDAGSGSRRREIAIAGHRCDEVTARAGLDDPEPAVRATALGALRRMGRLDPGALGAALHDPSPVVRRRAAELSEDAVELIELTGDPDSSVVEAACFGLGELGVGAPGAVAPLAEVCRSHVDPLCREAAVAALGAIGEQAGLATILAALTDRPAVRRRAVIALAPFSGPEVEAALRRALDDRDRQVRQAAEDLLSS
ncbi:MAG: HEAT repeat domain-containing protein [Actinomycetota bacterium]|nr:HEAT repeat domain-containing protein [Actinomycetota bacterium]